jgi:hypothetical protein
MSKTRNMARRARASAGSASLEQVILAGTCALAGLVAFKHYGVALNTDLKLQADRITGPGLPAADGFDLPSAEDVVGGLGGDRDPGGPELCRLDGDCPDDDNCFAAGTLVAAAEGLRAIESIRVGELVWSRDVETGAVALKEVTETFVRAATPVIDLELRSGLFGSERISVTASHRFWIEGQGWERASSLAAAPVGSLLSPGSATALSTLDEATTVYNLEVEDFHSYFVGQSRALVHNDCDERVNATVTDFQTAADPANKGCAAIPYAKLRQRCIDEQAEVHNRCDGNQGPVRCEAGQSQSLRTKLAREMIDNEALKTDKRALEDERARAGDPNERARLALAIAAIEQQLRDSDDEIRATSQDIEARRKVVKQTTENIQRCLDSRGAVMRIFSDALDYVRVEDGRKKPFARVLREKYEESKRGHEIAITDKENALGICRGEAL